MENDIDILVIEDEAIIAETIRQQLEDLGYNICSVCYKYETAVRAIEKADFDLVITDINLGNGVNERSGLVLMELMKRIKKCPFIFLTAFGDRDTLKKAASLYPSAYLVKPVNSANLFAAVQLAMENFNTLQAASAETSGTEDEPDYFFVKLGSKLIKIFWKDVYHLEAVKNYVRLKTPEYQGGLLIRGSLQQVMNVMMPEKLRSRVIKITRATAITKDIIKLIAENSVETTYGVFECTIDLRREIL